jgi:general secretion pathway protein I
MFRCKLERGFSLLEVLVALTILALSLGVLMQLYSTSMRNAALSGDYAVATDLGQSLLDEWSASGDPDGAPASGRHADRYDWSVEFAPVEAADNTPRAVTGLRLIHVVVTVAWSDGPGTPMRSVVLDTLRTMPPAVAIK